MSTKSYDKDGYLREVTDDGRRSWLYEPSDSFFEDRGACIEVADHHEDGTTTAYEYEGGILNSLLFDSRGARK